MNRRDFLRTATGGAGVVGAAGAARAADSSVAASASVAANNTTTTTAGNETGNESTTSGGSDLPGAGTTVTVELVDYAFSGATESPLYIQPGTTVKFVWKTDGHNINVDQQPDGADWSGVEDLHDTGYSYSHTFTTKGKYHFWCDPHKSLGMVGDIVVNDSGQPPGGGGGGPATLEPEEMGVPFQAQYVGLATLLMMFVTIVFTFFTLKYGSSPHASAPNKK